jgi:hypothetical protein
MIVPNSPNYFEGDSISPVTFHGSGDASIFDAFMAVLRISFIPIPKLCSTL